MQKKQPWNTSRQEKTNMGRSPARNQLGTNFRRKLTNTATSKPTEKMGEILSQHNRLTRSKFDAAT